MSCPFCRIQLGVAPNNNKRKKTVRKYNKTKGKKQKINKLLNNYIQCINQHNP